MTVALAFYAGAAFMTYLMVSGSQANRIVSAAFWWTFPVWPG